MPTRSQAATLALLGALAACVSDRPATAPEGPVEGDAVAVEDFAYRPPDLAAVAGTTVTWTNQDEVAHTVTADDGHSFGSDLFGEGETFQLTAPAAGTYPYHCAVHPFMKGTLDGDTSMKPGPGLAAILVLAAAVPAGTAAAQGVVDRTPNLDDGWTVPTGVIQFNFLHRFEVSPPPARKVTSFPNFRLATGLPYRFNVDLDYATNSTVFTGIPNEYQLALRRPLLSQARGAPLDLTATAGYAFAPQSLDGEVGLARRLGPVRLLGTVRGISSGYDVQRSLWGAGAGAVVRVTSWLSLAGDVFGLVNSRDGEGLGTAWGAGAQLRIPYSPHTFSIQVTNTQSASIEGSSRGVRGAHMAGFEFTIPFTLSRYFGHRDPPAKAAAEPAAGATAAVVRVANLAFGTQTLRVRAGTRVRWTNDDQLQHSVTADDGSFDSGLIEPGQTYERVFERPGEYPYHCTPHPFMKARVIVEP